MKKTGIFALIISSLFLLTNCVKDELREPTEPDYLMAGIFINELMTANNKAPFYYPDGSGEGFDWVELYNARDEEIDVSGMYLADEADDLKPENQLPENTIIPSGGYLVVVCSGNTSYTDSVIYIDMRLSANQDGDNNVFIYDPLGRLLDQSEAFGYESGIGSDGHGLDDDKSFGRYPDGDTTWQVFTVPTPGTENYVPPPVIEEEVYINELMCDNEDFVQDEYGEYDDWFEIYNPGSETIDIGGWYVTDNLNDVKSYQIPDTDPSLTTIPAGGYIVLWADDQPVQGVLHLGFKLSSSGEAIGISRSGIIFADSLEYGNTGVVDAPPANESAGRYPDGSENWQIFDTPTPGASNQEITPEYPIIFINEFMPDNETIIADEHGEYDDWIELFNPNTDPVNVGGWYLSDNSANPAQWQIPITEPAATTIPPEGFLLLWADEQPGQGVLHLDFRLSSNGESIILSGNGTDLIDSVDFGPSGQIVSPPADQSGGRKSDGESFWVIFENPSPGTPNIYVPPVTGQVYINEFMASNDTFIADQAGEYDDWIELYNSSLDPVNIGGWYITDDLGEIQKWQIPATEPDITTIPPGGFLIIWADEQMEQGVLHVDIKLSGNGESIGISADGIQFVDALDYGPGGIVGAPPTDWSAGREEDAGDVWMIFEPGTSRPPTPGTTNDGGK